jgi:hypothetical protein
MNARSLFLIFTAMGSAALGSSLAISAHWQAQGLQAGSLSASQTIPSSPVAVPTPVAVLPNPQPVPVVQPVQVPVQAPPVASPAIVPVTQPSSAEELAQARLQLRRAIREHNVTLLKSLLKAGSVREVLKTLVTDQQAVVDPINLDNLDASAWAILEKVMTHCNAAEAPGSVNADYGNGQRQPDSRSQLCF